MRSYYNQPSGTVARAEGFRPGTINTKKRQSASTRALRVINGVVAFNLAAGVPVGATVAMSFSASDQYPEHSRRLDEEGDVTVAYKLNDKGRVSDCRVTKSSGFPRLDEATCGMLRASVKSYNTSAQSEKSVDRQTVLKWRLPTNETIEREERSGKFPVPLHDDTRRVHVASEGELPAGRLVNLGLYVVVNASGSVESCLVKWGSGNRGLDKKACDIASKWRYKPAVKNGVAVKSMLSDTFHWAAPDAPIPTI